MKIMTSLLVLTLAPHLHAGFVHFWAIREIEDAPLLAVATVEGVAQHQPAPSGRTHSNPPEHYWQAALRVGSWSVTVSVGSFQQRWMPP
jgi:hypothetical protein